MSSFTPHEHPTTVTPDKAEEETIRDAEHAERANKPKDLRFWLIIASLLLSTFLSALDLTCEFPQSSIIFSH